MSELLTPRAMGGSATRVDGPAKVTGTAPYAFEHVLDDALYLHPVQSTIAKGRISRIDCAAAESLPGVVAVLTHHNAGRLADDSDGELAVLQSADVAFRGQIIAGVLAQTPEVARHAARLVAVTYEQQPHDVQLRAAHPDAFSSEQAAGADTEIGDVEQAVTAATVTVDEVYTTPPEYNNPMESHASVSIWQDGEPAELLIYDSTQSVHSVRSTLAPILGLPEQSIRVVSPYVGGGFGSKGLPHAHNVLSALAAKHAAPQPVKLALTRQQMFALAGYRGPTISRVRLAADAAGRLSAIEHEATEQTATIKEFAEKTAGPTRKMYAAPNRRTSHRLVPLDVAVPSWMRAPGECPGMFGPEVAMDELAEACGLDPIEMRARNEPQVDPTSGKPWSNRRLLDCLREGAERFGWSKRTETGQHRDGEWRVGLGVASATYAYNEIPGSVATVELTDDRYVVRIGAADIGTGAWTALTQIAADALGCDQSRVEVQIGDTDLPSASVAGGSSGLASWGSTIVAAVRAFRAEHGEDPAEGSQSSAEMPKNENLQRFSLRSFGAHFVEARVHVDTGEIRVPRMLGVFSVGRIINPLTARSQLIGGMTMGLSMALHEQGVLDPRFGHIVNHDFAEYHIATHADIADMDAIWLEEHDPRTNPMGARGIGEIGIVGAAAAVSNAVYNATGVRVRDLPVTADKML